MGARKRETKTVTFVLGSSLLAVLAEECPNLPLPDDQHTAPAHHPSSARDGVSLRGWDSGPETEKRDEREGMRRTRRTRRGVMKSRQ